MGSKLFEEMIQKYPYQRKGPRGICPDKTQIHVFLPAHSHSRLIDDPDHSGNPKKAVQKKRDIVQKGFCRVSTHALLMNEVQ